MVLGDTLSKLGDKLGATSITDSSSDDTFGGEERNGQFNYFKFLAASAGDETIDNTDAEEESDDDDDKIGGSDSEEGQPMDDESLKEAMSFARKSSTEGASDIAKTFGDYVPELGHSNVDSSVAIDKRISDSLGLQEQKVVGQASAWLLKDALCQGKALLSKENLYFYASLPFTDSQVIMESTLRTKSSNGVGSSRYWYAIRHGGMAYYTSAGDPFFPVGVIPLASVKSCRVEKDSNGESTSSFTLFMDDGSSETLKADSPTAAHEWFKAITKQVFILRNDGDFVKVVMPLRNITEIVTSQVMDFATHIRCRVVTGPDGEFEDMVLVFFSNGDAAIKHLTETWIDYHGENSVTVSKEKWALKDFNVKNPAQFTDTSYSSGHPLPLPKCLSDQLRPLDKTKQGEESAHDNKIGFGIFKLRKTQTFSFLKSDNSEPDSSNPSRRPSIDDDSSSASISATELDDDTGNPLQKITRVFKHKSQSTVSAEGGHYVTDEEARVVNEKFRQLFCVSCRIEVLAYFRGWVQRNNKLNEGIIYVTNSYLCFRKSKSNSTTRMMVPYVDINKVQKIDKHKFGHKGINIAFQDQDDIYLEVDTEDARVHLIQSIEDLVKERKEAMAHHFGHTEHDSNTLDYLHYKMRQARLATYADSFTEKTKLILPPFVVDAYSRDANDWFLQKPSEKLKITCLTIGSRGDVQPYIALCQGLMKEGHSVRICSHSEFREWVEGYGIEFKEIAGDPKALMEIMIEHGGFSISFLKEAATKFRSWVQELLESAWEAVQGSDVLIESPSAMAGVHIAEALGIPYFRAFTMPWTRTHTYPHAFIVPDSKLGGQYNYMTYVMFDNMMWRGTASQINKWRKKTLGIKGTSLDGMRLQQIPFLYCVSPHVLVPPMDQPDWIHMTGYWELEQDDDYEPDSKLVEFMKKARDDKKALVYIGFGSIVVKDPKQVTKSILEAVKKADVRVILAKGWSSRGAKKGEEEDEDIPMPDFVFTVEQVPHQWLFPKVDAAVHHGGSGTTGISLRSGIPTLIKPFFGDQFFYAMRVEDLGCGINLKKVNVDILAKALVEATTNKEMIERAKVIGEQIAQENGVMTAIQRIYLELPYARSLIRPRSKIEYKGRHFPGPKIPGVAGIKDNSKDDSKKKKIFTNPFSKKH